MTFQDLKIHVMYEIVAIKKFATKEEKEKLNINKFDFSRRNKCFYGQMTGDCRNDRAKELMKKCIKIYVRNENMHFFTDVKNAILSGEYELETKIKISEQLDQLKFDNFVFYTPLEQFSFLTTHLMCEKIMGYIKGSIENLEI